MYKTNLKPIIFWEGFPACGLLINDLANRVNGDIIVYATRPLVPFKSLSDYANFKIKYINDTSEILDDWEIIKDRNCFIFTGWSHSPLLKLSEKYKKENKKMISIMTVDNRLKLTLRQIIGSIFFRIFLRNKIDYVMVPGFSSWNLMKFFGMDDNKIYKGYYGAYTSIYNNIVTSQKKEKTFIYVGSLDRRKSFDILINSFEAYKKEGGTWGLKVIGKGPLQNKMKGLNIDYKGFLQPEETAYHLNRSRVLILPSRDDNWGTVVCEAAACGNLLITSRNVGASMDIVIQGVNGKILESIDVKSLKKEMFWFQNLSKTKFKLGHKVSLSIASQFTEKIYASSVEDMFFKINNE